MSLKEKVGRIAYAPLEGALRAVERTQLSRAPVLTQIPPLSSRMGGLGTIAYGEWCYTIGAFQTLIYQNLKVRPVRMLDVGCGVGRLFLAAKPLLTEDDTYHGIDVGKSFIDICQRQYAANENATFTHIDAANGYYATDGSQPRARWPIEDGAKTLITALSVWTHLREEDFVFYLNEVGRVLHPEGRAAISFFVMDEHYKPLLKREVTSKFYPQLESMWIFDTPAYDAKDFYAPKWAKVPEAAIGVTKETFDRVVKQAGLKLVEFHPGQWKDRPGLTFQDVAIFEKL